MDVDVVDVDVVDRVVDRVEILVAEILEVDKAGVAHKEVDRTSTSRAQYL